MKSSPKPTIIGHQRILAYLDEALKCGKINQAVLFIGPAHIGKKKLINWLIKHESCTGTQKPCGECQGCKSTTSNANPDLFWVSESQKAISISEIRTLRSHMQRSPLNGRTVWGVITDAHRMTDEASNALLKELEEPKSTARFLLTTSHPDLLLSTIRSRCVHVHCHLVPEEEISNALEAVGVQRAKAITTARLSQGRPGIAIQFLKDADFQRQLLTISKSFLQLLPTITPARASIFAASIPPETSTSTVIEALRLALMDSLRYKMGEPALLTGLFPESLLKRCADSADARSWANRLSGLVELEGNLLTPSKPQYIFERFFINV